MDAAVEGIRHEEVRVRQVCVVRLPRGGWEVADGGLLGQAG